MDSATLGGTIEGVARGALSPAVREARAVRMQGTVLLVAVRSLTGDTKPLPARGWAPRAVAGGDPVDPAPGDTVWVAEDEGGQMIVVAWEPA